MILACQNISKAFGTTEIIKNASFHIEEREKAALVGINGAGKSTLLKIIIGEMRADEGEVILSKGKTMGYLAQHQDLTGHLSIYQEVLTAKQNLIDMEERLRQMESDMNTKSGAELDELLSTSDLISLHCPMTPETEHLINSETIAKMKDGVILVNTSRGGLIKTDDLIAGIRDHKFFAVGLDVYEEESAYVYEDMSSSILPTSTIQRLLSFPNVTMTSHQGFFTVEALTNIAETTLENAKTFMDGAEMKNLVH